MRGVNAEIFLSEWVDSLSAKGKIAFTLKEVRHAFPGNSEAAIKLKLNRLFKKGKAISIHQGYYLIIPPQYASRGVLPPALYLDGLMHYLKRSYYLGLLNAASFYGAAHQQPQEFFVFTEFPVLRPTKKKGIKVNYISKRTIPTQLLENRKTEAGYLRISSPELTAADLVQFEKRIGGLNRAVAILNELTETIKAENINVEFLKQIPVTTIQRLGYLLEKVLRNKLLSDHLYEQSKMASSQFFRIPLKASAQKRNFTSDERWKVIINTEIEIDE
jgi:predicted transcriptional regulator of viral defense system